MALTISLSEGFKRSNLVADDLNSSIKMINSDNRALQFEGITNIRKILSVETGGKTFKALSFFKFLLNIQRIT